MKIPLVVIADAELGWKAYASLESKTAAPDQDRQGGSDGAADPATSATLSGQLIAEEADEEGTADGTETDEQGIKGSRTAIESLSVQGSLL